MSAQVILRCLGEIPHDIPHDISHDIPHDIVVLSDRIHLGERGFEGLGERSKSPEYRLLPIRALLTLTLPGGCHRHHFLFAASGGRAAHATILDLLSGWFADPWPAGQLRYRGVLGRVLAEPQWLPRTEP